jgi:hypothetical protein
MLRRSDVADGYAPPQPEGARGIANRRARNPLGARVLRPGASLCATADVVGASACRRTARQRPVLPGSLPRRALPAAAIPRAAPEPSFFRWL